MTNTVKLQQTASKLGISINVLREYMAAKAAEVTPRTQPKSNSLVLNK